MAIVRSDQYYTGTLATDSTVLVTIPSGTKFIMQGFWISNSNADDKKAEILISGKRYLPYLNPIPSGKTITDTNLNMTVEVGETIAVKGEVASDMDYRIWGVNEVTS